MIVIRAQLVARSQMKMSDRNKKILLVLEDETQFPKTDGLGKLQCVGH